MGLGHVTMGVTVRRADRPNAFAAGIAALALVVPMTSVGLAESAAAAPGDLARTGTVTTDVFQPDGVGSHPDGLTTTLSLSSPVAVFGHPVTARVAVTGGTPTGSVTVLVDGTPVAAVPLDRRRHGAGPPPGGRRDGAAHGHRRLRGRSGGRPARARVHVGSGRAHRDEDAADGPDRRHRVDGAPR